MAKRQRARGLLGLTAQAVKAFLEAFDPLGHALDSLVRSGYLLRIYVTAKDTTGSGHSITYLIEVDGESWEGPQEWNAEDGAFLQRLRIRVDPADHRRGPISGETGG